MARERRGLDKTSLARVAGIDIRSVTGFEAGEFSPSDQRLAKLAAVLGFPIEFFFGPDLDVPSRQAASFRAMTRMSAPLRNMALSQAALGIAFNKWLEERFTLPTPQIPDLRHASDPETAARTLREEWGLGELPIRNMIHLLEARGVRVFSLSIEAREVDAFSWWGGETPYIFLNTYKTPEHSRFDAAHELGHLVLHKHAGPLVRQAEREANAFASAFLMPRGSVIARAPKLVSYDALVRLKKVWRVSVAALNYRLRALDLTSEWHNRSLCV